MTTAWDALICHNYNVAYLDFDKPIHDIEELSKTMLIAEGPYPHD